MTVKITNIHLASLSALGDDFDEYEITDMFDSMGDDTSDPKECVTFVVKIAEDDWRTHNVNEFVMVGTH